MYIVHAAPVGPPLNFTAIPVSSRTLELSWEPPAAEVLNGLIRHYFIVILSRDTGRDLEMNFTTGGNRLMVPGLHPFYIYECTVTAFTVGAGPSVMVTSQLLQDGEHADYKFT